MKNREDEGNGEEKKLNKRVEEKWEKWKGEGKREIEEVVEV